MAGPWRGSQEAALSKAGRHGRRSEEGQQQAGLFRLPAATNDGPAELDGCRSSAGLEENATTWLLLRIAPINDSNSGAAGAHGGTDRPRVVHVHDTIRQALLYPESIQIGEAVAAKRCAGFCQGNSRHGGVDQIGRAADRQFPIRGPDGSEEVLGQDRARRRLSKSRRFQAIQRFRSRRQEQINGRPGEDVVGQFVGGPEHRPARISGSRSS